VKFTMNIPDFKEVYEIETPVKLEKGQYSKKWYIWDRGKHPVLYLEDVKPMDEEARVLIIKHLVGALEEGQYYEV